MEKTVLYIASALPFIWGVAHLIPTANVVKGFGEISKDNRHIIKMEWINEGTMLIFLGILILFITLTNPKIWLGAIVLFLIALFFIVLSIISFFTGFRVKFLPFKLCPVIFIISALLILTGVLV